jgi:hypothetical protein
MTTGLVLADQGQRQQQRGQELAGHVAAHADGLLRGQPAAGLPRRRSGG